MDFLRIKWCEGATKKQPPEIKPYFSTKTSRDLMIRGGKFYAAWDETNQRWTTKQDDVIDMIDNELRKYAEKFKQDHPQYEHVRVAFMDDSDSGSIDKWKKYCEKQTDENFHPLDETIIFSNTKPKREDYSTKHLSYALAEGKTDAWDELIGTLYSPVERHKIEWAIGSVVSGDSKRIQKFFVFYGSGGTGKSTVVKIIREKLFPEYSCSFDSKALCSSGNRFALESFESNPLVATDSEGDLSKIEDNTRLNALVSHDEVVVDGKYSKLYSTEFKAMLFVATNKPVKITDAKSGVIRRLVDVHPTGNKVPKDRYDFLWDQIDFELGAIAWHCLQVYKKSPRYYDEYVPQDMLGATNSFFNFVEEFAIDFRKKDQTTLSYAWTQYKAYCQEAQVPFPYSKMIFKEELKSYFDEFYSRYGAGSARQWNVYKGFHWKKFKYLFDEEESHDTDISDESSEPDSENDIWLKLYEQASPFDAMFADQPAQYAVDDGRGGDKPANSWAKCKLTLKDIDTLKLHYVRVPGNLIMIDFDIRDPETGKKSLELNLKAAAKFPKTYAETSKSGGGLHLYYFYDGDVNLLSSIYDDNIEVKVFPEDKLSSVRRKLIICNDIPVQPIGSGLPLRKESKVVNFEGLKNEKALRTSIKKNLKKEVHADTRSSVDFIFKILEDAYASGMTYDLRDMRPAVLSFAARSSHQAAYCIKLVGKMQFCSQDILDQDIEEAKNMEAEYDDIVIFDVEVFSNLFVVVWKKLGGTPVKWINPTPDQIRELCKYKLVGFNCRRYDNHILYARMMGYSLLELFDLSQRIIVTEDKRNAAFFREAYNASWLDLYDVAAKKQSLKKWEIELDIHHLELGLKWDQPVPEELWNKVADYCVNDVLATEALYRHLAPDITARMILADISGLPLNATTNQHTTQIIFGDDPYPQSQFVYTDLSEMFPGYEYNESGIDKCAYSEGAKIVSGKSVYMGEDPGEGGNVYSEPGMYEDVALLDIESMHPSSIIALNLFGDVYTKRFADLKQIRIYIKHEQYEEAAKLFDGKLAKYLTDKDQAKALSQALKIAINSVYGLTSAKFDNKFRDPRNIDNIVAKRGALFMIKLRHTLQDMGYSVVHVKTDSIKIPNATQEVIDFCMNFAQKYGYKFEHEATYEKMCLVNESVYIAKYKDGKHAGEWTATGAQFQIPYVFKTLFSHEPIEFKDLCETKTVSTALYLDFNEGLPDVSDAEAKLAKLQKAYPDKDGLYPLDYDEVVKEYEDYISHGHNYVFVGKAGLFCPMKDGAGGGYLMREKDGKYSYAAGCKGYRWMESETVRAVGKEDMIDKRYYAALVDEAIATISEYGDFEAFAS